MARTGSKPTANKIDAEIKANPLNEKVPSGEINYMISKTISPGVSKAFSESITADDGWVYPDQTMSGDWNFVKDASVVDNEGVFNGVSFKFTYQSGSINFTSDFDVITDTLEVGEKYLFVAAWYGLSFTVAYKKFGESVPTPTLSTPTLNLTSQDGALGYAISNEDAAATGGILTYDTNSDFSTEIPVPGYSFATKTGTISGLVNGTPYYSRLINTASGYNNSLSGSDSATPDVGYTTFDGSTNYLWFGNILANVFAGVDKQFSLAFETENIDNTVACRCITKIDTANVGFNTFIGSSDTFVFAWGVDNSNRRGVSWDISAINITNSKEWRIEYDGTIDTNNGLNRLSLYIDDVLHSTGKTLAINVGALTEIGNTAYSLAFGDLVDGSGVNNGVAMMNGDARKMKVWSDLNQTTLELFVEDLSDGTDSSGNNNDGTFV